MHEAYPSRYNQDILFMEDYIEKAVRQPFSASLERHALEAGIGLKLDYPALKEKLQKEPASRALDVLWIQLEKYESLLRDDGLSNCTSSRQL